ncbi:hypothetical protein OPIT5_27660 [Opitutaceae bacterium TAV5]|nr:hypothetical protein OPIT5_27660 [Opitutaceae bacterium TAV5]
MIRCFPSLASLLRTLCLFALPVGLSYSAAASTTPPASGSKRTLLVLVTIEGNENLQGFFVDPWLQQELEARGWVIEGRGIEEACREHFEAADAVVLLQEPYGVNIKGVEALRRLAPELDRYLRGGGGLLVIFDDRYFQVFSPVNELLAPYGARFVREAVIDSNPENVSALKNDDGVTLFRTRNLAANHPVTAGIAAMEFPQTENGKDSYPVMLSPEWTPLVRAEKTARSEDIWAVDRRGNYETEPVLAAARIVDQGRLVVFGAHSSLTFLHGSHDRWDHGHFLKAGMADFFVRTLDWLDESPSSAHGKMPALTGNPTPATDLRPVPAEQQAPATDWKKGVIVILDEEPASLEQWVGALRGKLDWVALVLPDTAIPEEADFARWKSLCAQASRPDFLVIPGGKVLDSFRNPMAALNPDKWPVRRTQRAINHIAREIGGHPVLLTPDENPWPVENIGGFQGFALAEYRGGALHRLNLETFRKLQAGDWFLAPQVVFYETGPEAVAAALEQGAYRTQVPAREVKDVPLKMPFLFHNKRNVVVSRGPEIRQAALTGDSLVDDPWEGLYYLWRGPQDHAVYSMDVHSLPENAEVRIYRDELLWRRYVPGERNWQHKIEFASTESLHSWWMEIWDGDRLDAISPVSRSRNYVNWAHGGGDRMNLYHSVAISDPKGLIVAHGQRVSGIGGLFFFLGWGDTLAPRPAITEAYPAGHEWGIPSGGIEYIRFAPQIHTGGIREYTVSKPRRIGYAMVSENASVLHETVDRKEALVDGVRTVAPAELVTAQTTFTVPVWEPEGLVSIIVDMTLTPLRDLDPDAASSIQLAEFVGRLKGSFGQVAVGRSTSAQPMAEKLFNMGPAAGRHTGQWFMLHPDPLGSLLIGGLDDRSYSLQVTASSKGPRGRFYLHPEKRVWKRGDAISVRFVVAITSGQESDPPALAADAMRAWLGEGTGLRLDSGKVKAHSGYLEMVAENGFVSGTLAPSGYRVVPLTCKIGGGSDRLPAYGMSLAGTTEGTWIPLGQEGGYIYHTIPTRTGRPLKAGLPVNCTNPELQVDVKRITDAAVEFWIHNPTAIEQRGRLSPSGLMVEGAAASASEDLTLAPGEERLVVFRRF